MKALVAILLVLTSQTTWGWILPNNQRPRNFIPIFDDLRNEPSRDRGEPFLLPGVETVPLQEAADDNSAPLMDLDAELEESELDSDDEDVLSDAEEEEEEEEEDGSGDNPSQDLDSNQIHAPSFPNGVMQNLLPKQFFKLFDNTPSVMEEFFKKERENIFRLQMELNNIMSKAVDEMSDFNSNSTSNTSNTTDIVEDAKGNKFKVQTVLKRGDSNQTLIVQTIESLLDNNRTKRSNWFAEPVQ